MLDAAFGESAFQSQSDLFERRIRAYGVPLAAPSRPFSWRLTDPERSRALLRDAGFVDVEAIFAVGRKPPG